MFEWLTEMPRRHVAILTCASHRRLPADEVLLKAALFDMGVTAEAVVWSEPTDWSRFDGALIRSTWDYHQAPDAFVSKLQEIEAAGVPLLNSAGTVRENLHKSYLLSLHRAGHAVVPTRLLARRSAARLDQLRAETGWRDIVAKPAIAASSDGVTMLREPGQGARPGTGQAELDALLRAGDTLVQPFLADVRQGEWSLVYFDGEFSHAVLKVPAPGEFRVQGEFGGTTHPATPSRQMLAQAQEALRLLACRPCYARVDGCVSQGQLLIMEIELIEPQLFLSFDSQACRRFAMAVVARLAGTSPQGVSDPRTHFPLAPDA